MGRLKSCSLALAISWKALLAWVVFVEVFILNGEGDGLSIVILSEKREFFITGMLTWALSTAVFGIVHRTTTALSIGSFVCMLLYYLPIY